LSQKEFQLTLSRRYDLQQEQEVSRSLGETRLEAMITAPLVCRFERAMGLQSLLYRFGYSHNYWSAQLWPKRLVSHLLSARQRRIIALVDTLKSQANFQMRLRKFACLQLLYLILFAVVAFILPGMKILPVLLPMVALFPVFRYWANLHGHVPISRVRSLPYSAHEIVWALIKRGWMESFCVWPIAAVALASSVYVAGNLNGELMARVLLVATTLVFAVPMPLVAFCLHDQTRQSTFNLNSLRLSIAFFGLVGCAVLAGILLATGSLLVAVLSAAMLLAVSYGMVSLSIATYRSSQVDYL